ncbi:MAG: hypothetical protein D6768_01885 [Chloroflexi bacterium]|nr:MAG: hypothetical protein D6768_01885 [Chloroflexota bacterium]
MTSRFEVSGGPQLLSGTITHATIHEVTDPTMPVTIIRTDQDWYVHLRWRLNGSLVRMIDGEWKIQVYLESIGQGPEFELSPVGGITEPVNPGSPNYDVRFNVSAGAVPAGQYKMVATILYVAPDGLPGPMAGFYDEPLVQFYNPGPASP